MQTQKPNTRKTARIPLAELTAFVAVAEHRSFTKAAAQVGIALPTMSQTIRSFEERLGVRLFNRTTRSVALTEAGDGLLAEVHPILDGIDHAIDNVNSFRNTPTGTLRLAIERPVRCGNSPRPQDRARHGDLAHPGRFQAARGRHSRLCRTPSKARRAKGSAWT